MRSTCLRTSELVLLAVGGLGRAPGFKEASLGRHCDMSGPPRWSERGRWRQHRLSPRPLEVETVSVDELVEACVEEWGLGALFWVSPRGWGSRRVARGGRLCSACVPEAKEGKVGCVEEGGWEPDADRALLGQE